MVAGVQPPTPEHPNPLPPQALEEGPLLQPPGGSALSKLRKPPLHQPDLLVEVRLDDRLFGGRQQVLERRLLGADELGEEAALREKLESQDGADRVRLLVRLEVEEA